MKVKIFSESNIAILGKKVQKFLDTSNITIHYVAQTESAATNGWSLTMSIWYDPIEETEEKPPTNLV